MPLEKLTHVLKIKIKKKQTKLNDNKLIKKHIQGRQNQKNIVWIIYITYSIYL